MTTPLIPLVVLALAFALPPTPAPPTNTPPVFEAVGGQAVERGCGPDGWCWSPCTVPEGWRIRRVKDVGALLPGQHGEIGVALRGPRVILLPEHLPERAQKRGWTMDTLRAHELAHACWQDHPEWRQDQ